MISGLAHIAIVVPDLSKAAHLYKDIFGAEISDQLDLPEHGVSIIKVNLPGCLIELLHPLGPQSPIQKFLDKNPDGGMHHLCFNVNDLSTIKNATQDKIRYLNGGNPKIGMEGKPVLFIHPKDMCGTLVELEEH